MIRTRIKTALLAFFRMLRPELSGAVILEYHSIGPGGEFFTVTPDMFERQLQYLKEKKLQVIPLRELLHRLRESRSVAGCVSLTFDDGYLDTRTAALPILEKYGMHGTVFVLTGSFGKMQQNKFGTSLPLMSEEDARFLSRSGRFDVMPHSVTHPKLTALPLEEAVREMEDSRAAVEALTGKPADIFCYPKGRSNEALRAHLRERGWLGAVSTLDGVVRPGDDLFRLKRNSINAFMDLSQFKAKVSDAIELYSRLRLSHVV